MGTFLFCSIVVTVVAFYAYTNLHGRDNVRGVEAGSCNGADADLIMSRSFIADPVKMRDSNGNMIDTSNFIRVVVCGNSMIPRKIFDHSQLLIEKVDPSRSLEEQLKIGDIVMIHLKEKHLEKLLVFDKFNEQKQLLTYSYDNEQERKYSSKPYAREAVIGVVRYRF